MSIFTPPVNKDELNKQRADRKVECLAESMLIDVLGDMMLQSNMPEDQKLALRVLLASKKAKDKIDSIVDTLCDPEIEATDEVTEKRKAALALVESAISLLEGNSLNNE